MTVSFRCQSCAGWRWRGAIDMELRDAQQLMATWLASRPYSVELVEERLSNGKPVWMAYSRELVGCKAHGETRHGAIENLKDARREYILSLLVDEMDVPEPNDTMPAMTVYRLT